MENYNAKEVLEHVENKIAYLERMKNYYYKGYRPRLHIRDVYRDLNIFDWWCEYLSISQLKDMRANLKTAIKMGYDGYACFKVGVSGCTNGMWFHKENSTNGYSPDGDFICHSFTPAYNTWDGFINGKYLVDTHEKENYTLKDLKRFIEKVKES